MPLCGSSISRWCRWSRLFRKADLVKIIGVRPSFCTGEEIILARAGKPYARLMPLEKAERRLGFMEGRVDDAFFDALPAEELDSWEGR